MLHSTTPINSYGKKFNEKAEKDEKSTKKFRYFFFIFSAVTHSSTTGLNVAATLPLSDP